MCEVAIFPSNGLVCLHSSHVSYLGHARITWGHFAMRTHVSMHT